MGRNVDLIQMLGLPNKITCPRCRRKIYSDFEEYDIDCGDPNLKPGIWSLDCYCNECDNEWEYNFKVKIEVTEDE